LNFNIQYKNNISKKHLIWKFLWDFFFFF
jgi:hypothetical protein